MIERTHPWTLVDLTLIDGERHEAILPAVAAGFRVALLNTFQSIWRLPGMPPLHHRVIPGRGLLGSRPGIAALWLQLRARKARRERKLRARGAGCDRISVLRSLCADLGLDMESQIAREHWLIPFTYSKLPVLCVHAEEFEFPHQVPDRVHYVGPMILRQRAAAATSQDPELSGLAALLAKHEAPGEKRKLLYAGFGSFFSASNRLIERILEAVRAHEDWDLVLSLGGQRTPADFAPLPGRVLALPWVPQLEVLEHADVAIVHGAINTYNECVSSGVPTLTYGGGETDMPGNAARAEFHGIGLIGDEARETAGNLEAHLIRLLEDPLYRTNIERLRGSYRRYEANQVAERTVSDVLLAESPSS
ncbi:MAG: nucleotide disphospho-sugar-binding domain-containing protein [Planctomycetota bacterium]